MKRLFLVFLIFMAGASLRAQSLLWEDFSGAFPPSGWTIDLHQENWSAPASNNAGGIAPEAMFNFYPNFDGVTRLISPVFDLTGATKVNLEFRHMVDDWSGGYTLGVATRTDVTGTWNTVWQINVTNAQAAKFVSVPISNANVNQPGFQFCFFFSGNTNGIQYWYLDNVSLYIPLAHDIRSENIFMGNQFGAGIPFTPSFQIRNIGRHAENVPVVFQLLDYHGNSVYQETQTLSDFGMDNSTVVNFTPYAPPQPDALYKAVYYANLPADMDRSNDTLSRWIETYTHVKQQTMLEIATGTWCFYCPGASMGAEELLAHGDSVAVIEYHDDDIFTVPSSANRIGYYQITSLPTAIFGGTLSNVGGSHTTSQYSNYLPLYRQQMAIKSPFELYLYGTHTGNNYSVDVNIQRIGQFINRNTVLHLALTESHIYYPWQNQDTLQYLLRLMAPDDHGTPVDLTSEASRTIHLDFSLDPSWVPENLEVSSFIQDSLTREIYNGNKIWLKDLVINGTVEKQGTTADRIGNNYPNPAITSTIIPVFTGHEGFAEISIWSEMGQKVTTLYQGSLSAGRHDLPWNCTDNTGNRLPGGIYCINMVKDGKSTSLKVILCH